MAHKDYRDGNFEHHLWDFRDQPFLDDPENDIDSELRHQATEAALRQEFYDDYLESAYWQKVKQAVFRRSRKCERCGSFDRLEIHHLAYPPRFTELENLNMLILLCQKCHNLKHL